MSRTRFVSWKGESAMSQVDETKLFYPKQERAFYMSGDNKGLVCPFKPLTCQEGYCCECQIYLEWQDTNNPLSDSKLNEFLSVYESRIYFAQYDLN